MIAWLKAYWAERTKHCSGCWYDMTGVQGTVCPECGRDLAKHETWVTDGRWRVWPLVGMAAACAIVSGISLGASNHHLIRAIGAVRTGGSSSLTAVMMLAGVGAAAAMLGFPLIFLTHRMTRRFGNNFKRVSTVAIVFIALNWTMFEVTWRSLSVVGP